MGEADVGETVGDVVGAVVGAVVGETVGAVVGDVVAVPAPYTWTSASPTLCVEELTPVTVNTTRDVERTGNDTVVADPSSAKLPTATDDPSENTNVPDTTRSSAFGRSNNTTRPTDTGAAHDNVNDAPTP